MPRRRRRTEIVQAIRDVTGGRGADICVDAVGLECDESLLDKAKNVLHGEVGSIKALRTATSAVRRGGWVTVTGVYSVPYDNFPLGQIFDKGIKMRFGQSTPQRDIRADRVGPSRARLSSTTSSRTACRSRKRRTVTTRKRTTA
jgi:threonine dehydrogenase-like Zn-dependent dehydrogenase